MDVPLSSRIVVYFTVLVSIVVAQVPQSFTAQNPCTSKATCSECIQSPSCAWCFGPEFKGTRCFQPSFNVAKEKCPEEFVLNPDNIVSVMANARLSKPQSKGVLEGGGHWGAGYEGNWTQNEWWEKHGYGASEGSAGGGYEGQIVQLAPQRVRMKLRAHQTSSIYMGYTQAKDYPVDLYYLMDLSRSMYDDKEKLYLLGDQLAQTMQNITSNFTLGFGSFVDKVVMPYVSTLEEKLQRPCEDCVAPYGFHHHMRLSTNTYTFSRMVKEAEVSGNLDAPEGGFDAIMQAVVCRNDIGWREQARRLLVFSTDASFHYAGDGKLGGIVKPNDGQCHMDSYGYYSESSHQDYPSIEQINLAVKKNSINVIFAVTKNTIGIYEQLAKHIEGASTAMLKNDSANIVELIKEQYQQISSSVEMKHNASSAVSIRFFSACLDAKGAMVNTNKCGNIKVGDVISFKVDIELQKCPENPKDRFQTIQIYPVGINESLTVELEMICQCDCERPGGKYYEEKSPKCHHHGTYKCGVCACEPGNYGRHCECNSNEDRSIETQRCIKPNSNSTVECFGRGQCICGRCECDGTKDPNERIYGDYCECDNWTCERHNDELCSGKDYGTCDCGICICKPGWTGKNCGCSNSTDRCYGPPSGSEICSGHGSCICGECKCEPQYSGPLCDKCANCPDMCLELRNCVECQMYQKGPFKDNCTESCEHQSTPIGQPQIIIDEKTNEHKCTFTDDDQCTYSFAYYSAKNGTTTIRAQEVPKCPPEVEVLGIVFGVIAAIVLIGMAILLLWKLLTTIHDRREFARFEKERMMAKWDTGENPIYKQATSTFKNPTYAGKG